MGITRREFGIATGAFAATALAAQTTTTPPPVLDIAEWSFHFYGVEHALLARGTVCNGMQMYVEHWIPTEVRHPYPVVLIHGGYGQGSDWFSTPDGRRGWASLLLEQGYKVYVHRPPRPGPQSLSALRARPIRPRKPDVQKTAASHRQIRHADPESRSKLVAPLGQPMANNARRRTSGAPAAQCLLDDIGPSILVTQRRWSGVRHGHGPRAPEPGERNRPSTPRGRFRHRNPDRYHRCQPGTRIASTSSRMARSTTFTQTLAPAADPRSPTRESTALKLADQGCFWIGVAAQDRCLTAPSRRARCTCST